MQTLFNEWSMVIHAGEVPTASLGCTNLMNNMVGLREELIQCCWNPRLFYSSTYRCLDLNVYQNGLFNNSLFLQIHLQTGKSFVKVVLRLNQIFSSSELQNVGLLVTCSTVSLKKEYILLICVLSLLNFTNIQTKAYFKM